MYGAIFSSALFYGLQLGILIVYYVGIINSSSLGYFILDIVLSSSIGFHRIECMGAHRQAQGQSDRGDEYTFHVKPFEFSWLVWELTV